MEKVPHIINYAENKYNAVCDSYKVDLEQIVLELRVVKETFEYSCTVVMDRKTCFILDYEFLWSWSKGKPENNINDFIHHSTSVQRSTSQKSQIFQNVPKPIRRKIAEFA